MASVDFEIPEEGTLRLIIRGRLDAESTSILWPKTLGKLAHIKPQRLEMDSEGIEYCDGAGIALLLELKRKQQAGDGEIQITGLRDEFKQLLEMFEGEEFAIKPQKTFGFGQTVENIGRWAVSLGRDFHTQVSFAGEVFAGLVGIVTHPGRLRLKVMFLIAEKSGANAVGIVALLGFLIGLIIAFQSAIAMAKFGAQIFVADLVVISLFRELGPLITAFVLASRSGSAFAAELGTMKINEEIDALKTMGLDPVSFLVIPRVIAAVFVMPLLTMFNLLFGLIGCGLVMVSIGFPPITYFNQIQQATNLTDLTGGLAKTFVFGLLISGIGCLRGLQTGTGASAVGDSATRAVVSSIVAIVVADGIFAVVYYYIGI